VSAQNRVGSVYRPRVVTLVMITVIGIMTGCENPITGYGPQPVYLDKQEHRPMLNVFGVLRPGTQNGMPLSFVHLEESFSVTSSPDVIEVRDADVTLFRYEGDVIVDSTAFTYTHFDSTFQRSEYRHAEFYPVEYQTYGLSCRRSGFPELTSKTTVPSVPAIIEDSFEIDTNRLAFSILGDSLAALYDITLWVGEHLYNQRLRRPEVGNIDVAFDLDANHGLSGTLLIYAYDLQLSKYMTYNVNVKYNTYRSDYSTVENGLGCFGSLNVLERIVTF